MELSEKIDVVVNCELQCKYCKARATCTGGTSLGPNGPVFTRCVDGDFDDLFDERAFDKHGGALYIEGYNAALKALSSKLAAESQHGLLHMMYPNAATVPINVIKSTASSMLKETVN